MLSGRAGGQGVRLDPGDGHTIRAGSRRVRLEPGDGRHQSWNKECVSDQVMSPSSELERGDIEVLHVSQPVAGRGPVWLRNC